MNYLTYQTELKQYDDEKESVSNDSFTFRNNKISVNLILPFRANRESVENFVYQGFQNHYQARIQHFLPNLVSISKDNRLKSVMGFRSGRTQPLFIEQYLKHSIESYFKKEAIERHQIGEFGNLIGTHRALTLQLFIVTFLALFQSGFKKLVFCATPQVKKMFDQFSVATQHIGTANPKKIGSQIKHWGNYYETNPELLAIDVEQVLSIIENSNRLSLIASKCSKQIDALVENLIQ